MRWRRRVQQALAPVLVAGALVAAGSTAPAHAESIDITWPETTQFNPVKTDYTIDVFYNGTGYLWLTGVDWEHGGNGSLPAPLPRDGSFTVDFPTPVASNEYLLIVWRCPTPDWQYDGQCQAMKIAPRLEVYDTFIYDTTSPQTIGPSDRVRVDSLRPVPTDTYDVSWAVTDKARRGNPTLLSGTTEDVPADGGFTISDPDGVLPEGVDMTLSFEITAGTEHYGVLRRSNRLTIRWDRTNVARLVLWTSVGSNYFQQTDTIYPFDDQQADFLELGFVGEEVPSRDVTVRNDAGEIVYSATIPSGGRAYWSGLDDAGRMLPEGRYKVIARSADWSRNVAKEARWVRLSHAELALRTWEKTLTAEETLVRERTGECGSIQRPARAAWPGSLGLDSTARCPASSVPRITLTVHEVRLPRIDGIYAGPADVDVGGQAAPGDDERYAAVRALNPGVHGNRWDWWSNPSTPLQGPVLGNTTEDPRIVIAAVATAGHRYDLRGFTVRIRYAVPVE